MNATVTPTSGDPPDPPLQDIQAGPDRRGISLVRVGITGLHYPLSVRQKDGGQQTVTACVDLTAGLHEQQRGAHLSSLVETLDAYHDGVLDLDEVVRLTREVRLRQDERGLPFDRADVQLRFKYFLPRAAPASGLIALVSYECEYLVTLDSNSIKHTSVRVPVTTLCPCSLEISDTGAHNQRAEVFIGLTQDVDDARTIWFEDLIATAEASASGPVHSLLKRADEKAVTERMFRTPRFTEDVVRDTVIRLRRQYDTRVRYTVRCEAFESIHPHNAYAEANGIW